LLEGDASDPGQHLLRRALWLEALDLQLRPSLPAALAAHARLTNIDRGRLVYLVDAPVWHARLRLAATEVLDAARSLGLDVTDLAVKITTSPLSQRPQGATAAIRSVKPLSAAARDAMRSALESDDGEPTTDIDS
jgi:hypothetical protein